MYSDRIEIRVLRKYTWPFQLTYTGGYNSNVTYYY